MDPGVSSIKILFSMMINEDSVMEHLNMMAVEKGGSEGKPPYDQLFRAQMFNDDISALLLFSYFLHENCYDK